MKKKQFESLKNRLVERHRQVSARLYEKHKEAVDWAAQNVPQGHKLVTGSLAGLLLMGAPAAGSAISHATFAQQNLHNPMDNTKLAGQLASFLPSIMRPLSDEEEQKIAEVLTAHYGFRVIPDVAGKRLDRTYGLIGAEQHLYRYPQDTLISHAENSSDWDLFGPSGIAPGLSAWGYFAPSKERFSEKDKQREKYYIAVQTFLSKDFMSRFAEYRDFYKYRKMLVVNPNNGRSIVADIADAGPGEFTGKHLGGSPEVMHYLERVDGSLRGPVLYFFIDDPGDRIKLGPVMPS